MSNDKYGEVPEPPLCWRLTQGDRNSWKAGFLAGRQAALSANGARKDCCGAAIYKDPGGVEYPCGDCPHNALPSSTASSAIDWLNGAQVDAEGRLILTRDYIVRCLRALPSATVAFIPTHRHVSGGLYRFVQDSRYKPRAGTEWTEAVIYEGEDRKLYVTTPARWADSFVPLDRKAENDHG